MLDLAEVDLPGVVHRVVESLSVEGIIEEAQKPDILRYLLCQCPLLFLSTVQ
jgi:hypothetical protein